MDDPKHPNAADGAASGRGGQSTAAAGEKAGDDADAMRWYVLKVTNNREKSVKASLERRIKREGMEEFFGEIVIPTQKVVDAKGGKKRVTEQKRFPGYMMIQMHLNDESWHLVRDTSGVADFTGAAGKPIAMQAREVVQMLGIQHDEDTGGGPTKVKIDLEVGEVVKVKDGPFESFEGSIETIDETHGKITVLIEIFGRPTPTDLEYWQVEKL
jgi:transcription termination/antitermination protein NusG